MKKLYPLLSDSFVDILISLNDKHKSEIASELILAHRLIASYNNILYWTIDNDLVLDLITDKIDSLITDEVRALTLRNDTFEISFTPKDKELIYNDDGVTWSRTNRQTGKPGRIINKVLKSEHKQKDIEVFNNLLKAHVTSLDKFEIVKGSDITHYYNEDTYFKTTGTLGKSCMRYNSCKNFFKIYEDHASMLITKRGDLITGRAILWNIDGNTYMDRIYTCYDFLEQQFIDYAIEHKWFRRLNNSLLSSNDDQIWIDSEGKLMEDELVIQLHCKYDMMPYMDSFRYYDPKSNTIRTHYDYTLVPMDFTEGNFIIHEYQCNLCGRIFYSANDEDELPESIRYSEYHDCYVCECCSKYCSGLDDYVYINTELVDVIYEHLSNYSYPLEYVKSHIYNPDNDREPEVSSFININNKWYGGTSTGFYESLIEE